MAAATTSSSFTHAAVSVWSGLRSHNLKRPGSHLIRELLTVGRQVTRRAKAGRIHARKAPYLYERFDVFPQLSNAGWNRVEWNRTKWSRTEWSRKELNIPK